MAEEVDPARVLAESARPWREVALCTDAVDREAAERAIRALYRLALDREPENFIWCASPAEAAGIVARDMARNATRNTAERGGGELGASVRESVRTLPWQAARTAACAAWGMPEWARRWGAASAALSRVTSRVLAGTEGAVVAQSGRPDGKAGSAARIALTYAAHGQLDAAWIAVFDDFASASPGRDDAATPTQRWIGAYAETVRQLGWWWPFEKTVVVCERPSVLHVDESDRLHYGDGPALAYTDGLALYRWKGTEIPADFSATLATLTPERIQAEQNAELRRIMFEHYSYERFIADSGAKPAGQDEAGRLWRIVMPGDEPVVMVEVVNATAEPDGSFNTYWLRVPPTIRSARAGVAWTFGLSEEEYRPQIQT